MQYRYAVAFAFLLLLLALPSWAEPDPDLPTGVGAEAYIRRHTAGGFPQWALAYLLALILGPTCACLLLIRFAWRAGPADTDGNDSVASPRQEPQMVAAGPLQQHLLPAGSGDYDAEPADAAAADERHGAAKGQYPEFAGDCEN